MFLQKYPLIIFTYSVLPSNFALNAILRVMTPGKMYDGLATTTSFALLTFLWQNI